MIQRIQSILLLFSGVAFASLFRIPFAKSAEAFGAIYENLTLDLNDNVGLIGLAGAGAVISLLTIFLYRNRKLQATFSYIVIFLGIVLAGFAFYIFNSEATAGSSSVSLDIGMGLPVISSVLAMIANVFIKKDEKLVKSMDRLR